MICFKFVLNLFIKRNDFFSYTKLQKFKICKINDCLIVSPEFTQVTVFALDDEVDQGKRLIFLRHWTESSDSKYQVNPSTVGNRMSMATMLVYVEEDDQAGIHLSHSNLQVLEGKSVDYNITLTSQVKKLRQLHLFNKIFASTFSKMLVFI